MPSVFWGRHIGYTEVEVDGELTVVPQVEELPFGNCGLDKSLIGGRHVSYTPYDPAFIVPMGVPIVATPLDCCESISKEDPQTECFLGLGTAYDKMVAMTLDVENCYEAQRQRVVFIFNGGPWPFPFIINPACNPLNYPGAGYWVGGMSLRGGDVTFIISCEPGSFPDYTPHFRLSWTGCDEGCAEAIPDCLDPLLINFGNVTLSNCCGCPDSEFSGTINPYISSGCKQTVFARHVSYNRQGIPIVAKTSSCLYNAEHVESCTLAQCGLIATIDSSDECACMNGSTVLHAGDGTWIGTTTMCGHPASIYLNCTDLGIIDHVSYVQLDLSIVCGADTTGVASMVIPALDLVNLDVTFEDVPISGPGSGCAGNCQWQWAEMPMTWSQITFCSGGCSCAEPSFPGTVDGQIAYTNCTGASTACCNGYIDVRITRE